jgi:hypothetical protein
MLVGGHWYAHILSLLCCGALRSEIKEEGQQARGTFAEQSATVQRTREAEA